MENASKALLMSAAVILGVLIISVGVALYSMFGDYSKVIVDELEKNKVSEYNNNFYKYYGKITYYEGGIEKVQDLEITAHDIVTIANFAKQANIDGQVGSYSVASNASDYVQIVVKYYDKNGINSTTVSNFEKQDEKFYSNFIKYNTLKSDNITKKVYVCKEIKTNDTSGKVIKVTIEEKK